MTLVKELTSRRSAREPRGGAADVPQRLSTLLGSTHTDMKRTRGPMAVHEQRASAANRTDTFDRVPHFPNPFTPHCRAMCRLVCGFCHAHSKASASLFEEKPRTTSRMRHGGCATSRELAVVLAQSSDRVGARADVSPPTALVSQEVDAPRRILLLLLLLLSLVVDERVAVPLVLLVAVSVLRGEELKIRPPEGSVRVVKLQPAEGSVRVVTPWNTRTPAPSPSLGSITSATTGSGQGS